MKRFAYALTLTSLAMGGCATKDYVHEYVGGQVKTVNDRVDANEAATKRVDGAVAAQDARIGRTEGALAELRKNTQEALDRANAAGKLAEGKLLYEVVLTDDQLRFGAGSANLSDEAKALLDDFAARLKAENRNVYIEIQGHTDSRGEEAANLKLGEKRADSVRHYLNTHGGIPLHRMAAISYGESKPVADNMYKDGRQQNRRVVLVVLK